MKEYTYDSTRVKEIINSENSSELIDLLEIEDLLAKISELDKHIDFFKQQKKKRTKVLDSEINELESQKSFIKDIIRKTLQHHKERSLTFPMVGTVKIKDGFHKWVVNDNDRLISLLKENLSDEKLEETVQERPTINKRSLDKILNEWENTGSWPSEEFKAKIEECITKEEIPSNIMTLFNKDTKIEPDKDLNFEDYQKEESSNLDDLFGEIKPEEL